VSLSDVATPRERLALPVAALLASLFVLGVMLVWVVLSMRAVMAVGGSCADGGPYVSAQPCPEGSWVIGVAIPLMLLAAFLGSFAAGRLSAPNLLVPMWLALFGSLGWNFLEFGFGDDTGMGVGWIVCGVVFELMALPALVVMVIGGRTGITARSGTPGSILGAWAVVYPLVGAAGALVGLVTFRAMT
jgi:hypothetical protein